MVIDSIQTLWSDMHEAGPGSVTQVRACAGELVRLAKRRGVAVVLVGHVTKDGQIAGPRVVEHMVDAVLSFEGERGYPFRILRGAKNRFGATDEIGVFEMGDAGLRRGAATPRPCSSATAASGRRARRCSPASRARGRCWWSSRPWSRPSAYGTPRRAVVGWDSGRLAMILAVLEARCGVGFGDRDVYLNVAGGLQMTEPAADLAAAAALVSSALDVALPQDCVVFGEISLSGDVRPVARTEMRLKEAAKLGFWRALGPAGASEAAGVRLTGVARLADAVARIGGEAWDDARRLSLFDLAAGLVLIVSALVGWIRGALARGGDGGRLRHRGGRRGLRPALHRADRARTPSHTPWLANIAAILIVFVAVYILLRVLAGRA